MGQETIASRLLPGWLKAGWLSAARLASRRTNAPAPAAAAASVPVADGAVQGDARPAPPLAILAAALRVPHAASPAELALAIARSRVSAELDPELVDDRGFPIMTARCADADDEAVRDRIAIWLAGEGLGELAFSDEQWRALALASAVAGELAADAAAAYLPASSTAPLLDALALLPPGWSGAQRTAAGKWLRHRVAQCGWPPERIVASSGMDDAGPAAIFARLARDAAASAVPRMILLVACDSAIGADTIARWTEDGALFSASHAQGILPGEGAVALLLAAPRQAAAMAGMAGAAAPALTAFEEGRRTTSADDSRRADPVLLLGLADRTLRHGGAAAPDVAMLVADTGHRSNRVLELMGCTASMLPHLDDLDDVVRAGLACGHCGVVPFMTALALGWHYALERAAPVVCVGNEDAFHRCVALVRPFAQREDTAA